MRLPLLVVAAVLLAGAPAALGQDQILELGGYRWRMAHYRISEEDGSTVFTLIGDVRAEKKGIQIRADRVVAVVPQDDKTVFGKLYIEGNFVCRRLDEASGTWDVYRADRLWYDVAGRRGHFVNFQILFYSAQHRTPVSLRAGEAWMAPEGETDRLRAVDVVATTCAYSDPHYGVRFERAEVDLGPPKPDKKGEFDFWPYEKRGWKFTGTGTTVNVWGVSLPFFPIVLVPAAISFMPIRTVNGGRTSRFGTFVETDWGLKIEKGFTDALNPWDSGDPNDDDKDWGELNWELDWRQIRGWAGGIDPSWSWEGYHGYIDSYYLRDRGPTSTNEFDRKFLPLISPDRARVRGFHRHALSDDLRLELEGSYLSDRNLLEEFFEQEFKSGKEQETVGYVRWMDANAGAFVLQRNRINDFQTQLEYLPRVKAFLLDEPLLGAFMPDLTFSQELEGVHLRQRFDEELDLPEPRTWRGDSLSTLVLSIGLGALTVAPFAEARFTSYEHNRFDDPANRLLGTAGGRVTSEWTGLHDIHWDLVGLRRLRHIMLLEGRYASTFSNTLDTELFGYDAVDAQDKFAEVALELRHRFQTKALVGEQLTTVEFLELGVQVEYYPDPLRDTTTFNVNNFSAPFNWITLPAPFTEDRHWSNIHWDAVFRPASKLLEVTAAGEYNPLLDREDVREFMVRFAPQRDLLLAVGQVRMAGVTDAISLELRWQLAEKWRLQAEVQFDIETDDYIRRKAVFVRDLHDFVFEVIYEEDVGRSERKFYFTVVPSFLQRGRSAAPRR